MSWGLNPRVWFVFLLVSTVGLAALPALAQDEPDVTGTWLGKLQTPQGSVDLTVSLKQDGTGWRGTITGPRGDALDLKNVQVSGNQVRFSYRPPQAPGDIAYSGALNDDQSFVEGKLAVAPGMDLSLNFVKIDDGSGTMTDESGVKRYRPGSGPAGIWLGHVETPEGEEIPVTLSLDQASGAWGAVLNDPFMGDVSAEDLRVSDALIAFNFRPETAPFPSTFSGTYIAADDRITGTVSQRGASRFVKFRRKPGTVILTTIGPDGKPQEPAPIRHNYKFAVTGRLSYWPALHMVKDEVYNLNNITTGALNYDGTLRYFVLDEFSVFVRGFRGGLGYDTIQSKLDLFADIGLNSNTYMKLDGYEFGFVGYLGNIMARKSKFNPYLTAAVGRTTWAAMTDGRNSTVLMHSREPLQGTDMSIAGGFGTEYALSENFCLEMEFLWRYFLTEDELRWEDIDTVWTNTHAWSLSFGLTYGFF